MQVSDIILLSIAALLIFWVCCRVWRRARAPLPETHWTGHGIDVTPVSERVERVRRDFAAELKSRPIVEGSNPFRLVTSDAFTATKAEMTLSFAKGGIGDSTALIDDIRLLSRGSVQLAISMIDESVPAIRIQGIPGRMLTLEFKHSLMPEVSWQPLLNVLLTNGWDVFVDSEAPTSPSRFYRAWQP